MRTDIEMHAGHMGTEAGAFVPRRAAKRFIEQQTAIFAGLNQSQAAMADLYFSLWSNTYHEQVRPGPLEPVVVTEF
jgi:hypothetical protein